MMVSSMRFINSRPLILVIGVFASVGAAQQSPTNDKEPRPVAILVDFGGNVSLQRGTAQDQPLKNADKFSLLFQPGDMVNCLQTNAWFSIMSTSLKRVTIEKCTRKYVFATSAGDYADVLERYGRTGGRSRGGMLGLLLWPATGVRTLPSTAAQLRWRPQRSGTVSVALKGSESDPVVWQRDGIDAVPGTWTDPSLVAALRALVDQGRTAPVLELRVSETSSASATLSLMSRADEQRVSQQLSAIALDGPERHLLAADVFTQADLRREALDEYVALLETEPQSPLLLAKAAGLATEISDVRAADLVKRARAAGAP